MDKLVIFILGPTAAGKTAVSIQLAKKINPSTTLTSVPSTLRSSTSARGRINGEPFGRLRANAESIRRCSGFSPELCRRTELVEAEQRRTINAQIVSCDSMQVYRGIDILSSKPTPAQLAEIKHYLIDVVDPGDEYDVARYAREASAAIEQALNKGKVALVVGGTGLYATILLDGIFEDDKKNLTLRKNLYQEAQEHGSVHLHNRLKSLDEKAACEIHQNDTKRIVRALEVCLMHENKFSEIRQKREGIATKFNIKMFGLNLRREILYEKIEKRIDEMFEQGVVEEISNLSSKSFSQTALMCLGVREIQAYLKGEISLEQAKNQIKKHSRRYAKRQLTWFRQDKRIQWIDVTDLNAGQIVENIKKQINF